MNKYLAEGLGTFALVFFACGSIIVNDIFAESIGHLGYQSTCLGVTISPTLLI